MWRKYLRKIAKDIIRNAYPDLRAILEAELRKIRVPGVDHDVLMGLIMETIDKEVAKWIDRI